MIHTLLALDSELLIWARTLIPAEYALLIQILGESVVVFVALFLIGIWLYGVYHKENTYKIIALRIFTTILLTFIIYTVINFGIEKWRPSPQEIVGGLPALIPHPLDNSFPSGHALFTAAFLTACISFFRHSWIIVIGICLGIMTAFARVTGGVHYPGDILGGWIFGSFGAWMMIRYILSHRFFEKTLYPHILRLAHLFRL